MPTGDRSQSGLASLSSLGNVSFASFRSSSDPIFREVEGFIDELHRGGAIGVHLNRERFDQRVRGRNASELYMLHIKQLSMHNVCNAVVLFVDLDLYSVICN